MKTIALSFAAGCFLLNAIAQDAPAPAAVQAAPGQQVPGTGSPPAKDPLEFYRRNPELMKRYFPQSAQSNEAAVPLRFSIDFPGGTPEDLLQHLRVALGTVPNVVISPKMQNALLPKFRLQNVTLEDVFLSLNQLGAESGGAWQMGGSREPVWVFNPVTPPREIDPLTGQPLNRTNRLVRVFPVGNVLIEDVFTVEDITTAAQTAWDLLGEAPGAEIKFHKDTNLLIAVGTPQQMALLEEVLTGLAREVGTKIRARQRSTATDRVDAAATSVAPGSNKK